MASPAPVARVHLGPWPSGPGFAELHPEAVAHDGVAPVALHLLVAELCVAGNRGEVVAEVDEAGHWTTQPPGGSRALARLFGGSYQPSDTYVPHGRAAAVAMDLAAALGGRYEHVGEDQEEEPGAVY